MIPNSSSQPPAARLARDGLGWLFTPSQAPVILGFSRLIERSSELTAELHVQTVGREHIMRRRINLLGPRAPADLAKDLDLATDGAGWPWRKLIEQAFASVIEAHRAGEPVQLLGGRTAAPPPSVHDIDGVLMQGRANTWFGPGGTGKSTAAAAACVATARGSTFAGRPTRRGVPLYLDWEDEKDAFEEMLWEVSRGLGLDQSARVHWRRMSQPLVGDLAYLSALIDRLHVTLVVIDSATRAMGGASEHGTYEATAVAFAEAIRALGTVTTLIVDHVDGATVKEGGAAKKAYGSIHKLNFVRNAWSLTLDPDAGEGQVVGWTHAKVNRGRLREGFGVRYDRDRVTGGLELVPLVAADVPLVAATLPQWRQVQVALEHAGPLTVKEAAMAVLGRDTEKACNQLRAIVYRDHGAHIVRLPDGRISARNTPLPRAEGGPWKPPARPALRVVPTATSPATGGLDDPDE